MKRIITVIITLSLFILSSCTLHTHTFSDATCTKPQICTECNLASGEPKGHAWVEDICKGLKHCSVCNAVTTTEGKPLGHDFSEATCTENEICRRCGYSQGEALGHALENPTVEKQPTCSETGIENGTCTRCGETITQEIPTLEHISTDWIIESVPLATKESGVERKFCTICNKELDYRERVFSNEEKENFYLENCESVAYKDVARNPYQYEGKYAKFTGKVMQVVKEIEFFDITSCYYLVQVTKDGYFWKDIIYVGYERSKYDSRILEDDVITFYGVLSGSHEYETTGGTSNTVPYLYAKYYTLH